MTAIVWIRSLLDLLTRTKNVTRFEECLPIILEAEGGYVNHPSDPGGMTNLGVTKRVYEEWMEKHVDEKTMRALTKGDVAPIYETNYWKKVMADDLPKGLDLCVFDFAVNAGPSRAVKYLQKMVGATEDGHIGPKTLASVAKRVERHGVEIMITRYSEHRTNYYESLKTFPVFGRGWLNRVEHVQEIAKEHVKGV